MVETRRIIIDVSTKNFFKGCLIRGDMAHLLVVDDEPDIRDTVQTALIHAGFEVTTARDGDDCIEKCSQNDYDLILLDVMMPGTSVNDVVEKLHETKIVFLTIVRTTEAEKKQLLESNNVVDFIQKPFDVDDLVDRVKKVLE